MAVFYQSTEEVSFCHILISDCVSGQVISLSASTSRILDVWFKFVLKTKSMRTPVSQTRGV